MKKIVLVLGSFLITFASFGFTPLEFNNNSENGISISADVYPVIATTDNGYMENYSIAANVHATCLGGNCSVNKVVVEGTSVSYSYFNGKYSFSYGRYTYYFKF